MPLIRARQRCSRDAIGKPSSEVVRRSELNVQMSEAERPLQQKEHDADKREYPCIIGGC